MPQHLLGNKKMGLLFVLSAPAGGGKTTLVEMLTQEFDAVVQSVSYTTRQPRKGEMEGIHYHFVSKQKFERLIDEEEFVEFIQLHGEYYGTSSSAICAQQAKGKHVILAIDVQGAREIKEKYGAVSIFLMPPSLDELKQRLTGRGTETLSQLNARLAIAEKEINQAQFYDYTIINDDLQVAYQVLKSVLIAEEHRVRL